jgi:hypothetical protein
MVYWPEDFTHEEGAWQGLIARAKAYLRFARYLGTMSDCRNRGGLHTMTLQEAKSGQKSRENKVVLPFRLLLNARFMKVILEGYQVR